ncbi:MAG: polysaccharide biosynthesis/export family protein [Bacteroidetes bacterium]|nr:polysaccharide biosynthesis/export family protein [Bacteroidota bacterium]
MRFTCLIISLILLLGACVSPTKLRKEIVFFNEGLDSAAIQSLNITEPAIQKGDLLQIIISTRSSATNLLFSQNLIQPNVGGNAGGNASAVADMANQYLVDIASGDIKIPLIGTLHAEGLTKSQLEKEVLNRAMKYVNEEPVVNIRYLNFRITFLGSVGAQGTKQFQSERVSFLQALGEAGGITPGGDLKNILLFREQNGKRTVHKIDLTNGDFLNSPENFLRQNDILYVSPTTRQLVATDMSFQRNFQFINLGVTVLNLIFILTNIFR